MPSSSKNSLSWSLEGRIEYLRTTSVVALIVENPQRFPAKDGSQQYVLSRLRTRSRTWVDGQLIRPSRSL